MSDIDECETGLSNCTHSENCHNLNGTFECGSAPIIMTTEPGVATNSKIILL